MTSEEFTGWIIIATVAYLWFSAKYGGLKMASKTSRTVKRYSVKDGVEHAG